MSHSKRRCTCRLCTFGRILAAIDGIERHDKPGDELLDVTVALDKEAVLDALAALGMASALLLKNASAHELEQWIENLRAAQNTIVEHRSH